MSDYLDHLASVSLNQTRGFQFNVGELRPRLASQFEPAVANAPPATWLDDESEKVESTIVDRDSNRSRMLPGQGRVPPPSGETSPFGETEVPLPRQPLTVVPPDRKLFDGALHPTNNRHTAAPPLTVEVAEYRSPATYEAQLASNEIQPSPPPPHSRAAEQADLEGESFSLRTRGSPMSSPRQSVPDTRLHQPARGQHRTSPAQSPDSLAPQAAFVEVRRFLDSKFVRISEQPTLHAQPSNPVLPTGIKESRHTRAAGPIEVASSEDGIIEDDSHLTPPDRQRISLRPTTHVLHGSRLTVMPPTNQVGTKQLKLNGQPPSRREGPADRSVEDDAPVVPTIQVTIGRVEVRAQMTPAAPAPRSRSASIMTLEDYLQRRTAGGSQ